MDSTKNVKGNRKMVEVEYLPVIDYYKIPDGLDLNDRSVVAGYWVKWRVLHIKYVGIEEVEKHEPEHEDDNDFKNPDTTSIVDADECYVTYDDDEINPIREDTKARIAEHNARIEKMKQQE